MHSPDYVFPLRMKIVWHEQQQARAHTLHQRGNGGWMYNSLSASRLPVHHVDRIKVAACHTVTFSEHIPELRVFSLSAAGL